MTLSILATLIILITLPISLGIVKGIDFIYTLQSLKSNKMLNAPDF